MENYNQYVSPRSDWTVEAVLNLFEQPFNDLLFTAQGVHRANFDANEVQLSTLMNIKSGGCAENCGYCSQSAHHDTAEKATKLVDLDTVINQAKLAKSNGASRFCMGAAWRELKDRDVPVIEDMVREVKSLGLETCMTLGMLKDDQAERLKSAGLDYYNHNIDTSEEHYPQVVSTRTFEDRLDTISQVVDAGIKVCCGGIMGMGENTRDRASMLVTLAKLPKQPDSVPINKLVPIPGTPMEGVEQINSIDFVKMIAVTRIVLPRSYVRLSAGRTTMSEELQALCLAAGINSIFYGDQLLTTQNPQKEKDDQLLDRLGVSVA